MERSLAVKEVPLFFLACAVWIQYVGLCWDHVCVHLGACLWRVSRHGDGLIHSVPRTGIIPGLLKTSWGRVLVWWSSWDVVQRMHRRNYWDPQASCFLLEGLIPGCSTPDFAVGWRTHVSAPGMGWRMCAEDKPPGRLPVHVERFLSPLSSPAL